MVSVNVLLFVVLHAIHFTNPSPNPDPNPKLNPKQVPSPNPKPKPSPTRGCTRSASLGGWAVRFERSGSCLKTYSSRSARAAGMSRPP